MRLRLHRTVSSGMPIPRGFRVAYYDIMNHVGHCYPIGLHLVVMFIRRLWQISYWWSPSRLDRLIQKAIEEDRCVQNRIRMGLKPYYNDPDDCKGK